MLPPGQHEIFVRARSAEPTRLQITLSRNAQVCLRTSSSPTTLAKTFVPVSLIVSGYHFYLDEMPCPSDQALDTFKLVPVNYTEN